MSERFVIVDLETTGNTPTQGARIIQIGAVKVEGRKIIDRFNTFVDPACEIPPFIAELTGITAAEVKGAPAFAEVAPQLLAFMDGCAFVAHNVPFDQGFLTAQLDMEGYHWLPQVSFDTVEMSRVLFPSQDSYKLSELSGFLALNHTRPHQADSDALITAELFLSLVHKLESLPLATLQQLDKVTLRLSSDWSQLIRPVIKKKMNIHAALAETQYDMFGQLVLKRHEEKSEKQPSLSQPSFTDTMTTAFTHATDHVEDRPGQRLMMERVYKALSSEAYLLLEAGTGTGKTLGYLLPSVHVAKKTGKPVVVSTYTVALQEQLLQEDIPLLCALVDFPVEAAILKGRHHYLDVKKFERSLAYCEEDSYDVLLTKAQILVWLLETANGDRTELNLSSGGENYWLTVQSDYGDASDPRCFYQRAQMHATEADIIIVNHALLMIDTIREVPALPSVSHVIVDEAHHFADVARDHLGTSLRYVSYAFAWQRLARLLEEASGLSLQLQAQLTHMSVIQEDVDDLFRMLRAFVMETEDGRTGNTGRRSCSYAPTVQVGAMWQAIFVCAERIYTHGLKLIKVVDSVLTSLQEAQCTPATYAKIRATNEATKAVYRHTQALNTLLLTAEEGYVYWIEAEPKGAKNATYLYRKPMDVSDCLADQFFARKRSVVLTSATLTVNDSFSYYVDQLGLADFGVETLQILSPFAYETQTKLLIPSDVPDVRGKNDTLFVDDIAIKIWRIAEETNRKVLVLFTSYDMLRKVYYNVRNLNETRCLPLIGQGVTNGSPARLLKIFKHETSGILFGTNSFWEGMDLRQAGACHLVIVRLPFASPDEPFVRAQIEQAKSRGKDPFKTISLPQAVIRFKQGFGRLIRSTADNGAVFVFDRRIVTTKYGATFIQSLPSVPVLEGKLEALLEMICNEGEE
ncbi:ATP-dependent DNA helicase DinG [Shouchella lonarensis]|uniref:3'-5' exonuclease DinG n=1 Tax=Shouchella lonarensis TaxID=1464122 RepID=A0A1G6HA72_9BACI|nr:ATP-dependent DNA helicase DinG [Shouchella lonarensis]SDB91172.1 ATP-dependent DNA helicase DinG [Shouchella lonarensis]